MTARPVALLSQVPAPIAAGGAVLAEAGRCRSQPARPDVVYGFGRIDAPGRVADRVTIAALGLRGGDRLTVGLYLLVRYLYLAGLMLVAFWTSGSGNWPTWSAMSVSIALVLAFTVAYFVLVERAVTGFRPLQPQYCSIYQAPFWRHERYWKVHSNVYQHIFDRTPFKGLLWRLLGVRIGRRVFDDGCAIVERSLVSVGNDCTLGMGSIVQSHSLEDGTFKSDHITIGAGCTVGTGAFLLYGATMGDGSVIGSDSFLMKGEHVPPRGLWRGNPATEVRPVPPPAPVSAARWMFRVSRPERGRTDGCHHP